jgi:hypothetical protein
MTEQIYQLEITVDYLQKIELSLEQQKQFVGLANSVMREYKGEMRKKEMIRGKPSPSFLHLLKAVKIICQTYLCQKYPEQYDLNVDKVSGRSSRSQSFIRAFENRKFEIVMAVLLHDIPEDFKMLLNHADSENTEQNTADAHNLIDLMFKGNIKYMELEGPSFNIQNPNSLFNGQIESCVFGDLLKTYADIQ